MLDNIFLVFDRRVFWQTVGILTGNKHIVFLADIFLYSQGTFEVIASYCVFLYLFINKTDYRNIAIKIKIKKLP